MEHLKDRFLGNSDQSCAESSPTEPRIRPNRRASLWAGKWKYMNQPGRRYPRSARQRSYECRDRRLVYTNKSMQLSSEADNKKNTLSLPLANLAHHMTVSFLGSVPAGGTYFSRIGKNTSISPVLLENLADITDLARYFGSQISVAVHVLEAKADSGRLNLVFNKANTALADLIAALKSRGMGGRPR